MRGQQSGDLAFGRFALKRVLGRGGMGVVWLAEDTLLGREIALKFAPDTLRSDDAAIEELKGETRRGQDLAHPNIVRIFDFFLDDQHAAICMEYVDGDTLAKLRVRQPNKVFEPHQIARWVIQMLDGLSYAHRSAKIAHRDLKPPNLIINSQGDLKIMDFGIARSIQDSMSRVTIAGNSTGTLAYMSPQQAAGRSASIADDIYSLGSTLYELFTGKPPFYSGDFARQIRDDIPPPVSERRLEFGITAAEAFPAEWENVISRCLAKLPEQRPASIDEVRELLGFAMGGQAPSLAPSSLHLLSGSTQHYVIGAETGMSATAISAAGKGITVRASNALSPLKVDSTQATSPASPPSLPQAETPKGHKGAWIWLLAGTSIILLGVGLWAWLGTAKNNVGVEATKVVDPPEKTPVVKPDAPVPLVVPSGYPTIQAALAAAKPGETVRLEAGTYEERVRLVDGVSLAAVKPDARVLIIVDGKSGSVVEAEKLKDVIKIDGITFAHGGEDLGAGSAGPSIASIISSQVTFENCVFEKGLGDGLRVEGSSRVTLKECSSKQNQGSGFVAARGARMMLDSCRASGNGTDGLSVATRGTVELVNGTTELMRNQNNGVTVQQGSEFKAVKGKLDASENVLNGCYAADADTQVEIKGAKLNHNGFVFTGTESKGTESGQGGGGLVAEAAARVLLEDSQIEGNAKSGVQILDGANGSAVRRCTITGHAYRGIMVIGTGSQEITIEGNQCLRGGQHGITVEGTGFRPHVLRNHCAFNALTGIYIYAGAQPVLEGNTFEGNAREVETATR